MGVRVVIGRAVGVVGVRVVIGRMVVGVRVL